MIAQDFARVGVLGSLQPGRARGYPSQEDSGSIAMPYGVATMCAHAGKSAPQADLRLRPWSDPTVRARGQRSLYWAQLLKKGKYLIESK